MPLRAEHRGVDVVAMLLDDEEWSHLAGDARADHSALTLPGCGSPAYPRRSKRGTPHFAHRPGSTCTIHAPETADHLEAKALIHDGATAVGWLARLEAPSTSRDDGGRPHWIADVLATTSGRSPVALEVQWSRQDLAEYQRRQARYAADGVRGVWFARHPPGIRSTRDLPVFALCRDAGGQLQVTVEHTSLPLQEAVTALLTGRIQFRNQLGSRDTPHQVVNVQLTRSPCWKCGRPMTVWRAVPRPVVSACGMQAEPAGSTLWAGKDRLEAAPRIKIAVARHVGTNGYPPTAAMAWRRRGGTQQVPQGYLAFCCPNCGIVQGDFHLDADFDNLQADLGDLTVVLDDQPAIAPDPHWCLSRDHGHCPP